MRRVLLEFEVLGRPWVVPHVDGKKDTLMASVRADRFCEQTRAVLCPEGVLRPSAEVRVPLMKMLRGGVLRLVRTAILDDIVETVKKRSSKFGRTSSGVVIVATDFRVFRKGGKWRVSLVVGDLDGVLDGGHTVAQLMELFADLMRDLANGADLSKVDFKVELIIGADKETRRQYAFGRNTKKSLRSFSKDDYKGCYNEVRAGLPEVDIVYHEGLAGTIPIAMVVQILFAFLGNATRLRHCAFSIFQGREATMKWWSAERDAAMSGNYKNADMLAVLANVAPLMHIVDHVRRLYLDRPGFAQRKCTNNGFRQPKYPLGKGTTRFEYSPKVGGQFQWERGDVRPALIYPIIAAYRANLAFAAMKCRWTMPLDMFERMVVAPLCDYVLNRWEKDARIQNQKCVFIRCEGKAMQAVAAYRETLDSGANAKFIEAQVDRVMQNGRIPARIRKLVGSDWITDETERLLAEQKARAKRQKQAARQKTGA